MENSETSSVIPSSRLQLSNNTSGTAPASGEGPRRGNARGQHCGWAGCHFTFLQKPCNMRNLILLDSDSIDTLFWNENYVTKIRPSKTTLDMLTNGGPMAPDHICNVPDLDTRWYNPDALTNIITLADLS
eukprot:14629546-Ditylum_brightwellii.AAC.1